MRSHLRGCRKSARFKLFRPPGCSALCAIACLIVLSFLAVALISLSSAPNLSVLVETRKTRAYYLALSGLNAWSLGMTGTFTLPEGSFTLSQAGPDASGYYTVTSTGKVMGGSAMEANAVLSAKRSSSNPITFTNDLGAFQAPVVGKTENSLKAITIAAANSATDASAGGGHDKADADGYASGSLQLGGGTPNTAGAIWYTGSHGACTSGTCPDGMCLAGRCSLAKGLRAYFGFVFANADTSEKSTDYGDGFTFTIMHASGNNTATAAGGPRSGSRGEYLGYAGPGPSGCGIAAPKMAVEVDTYPNKHAYPPELADSRRDHSDANHIAAVFWGATDTLYDDNVHGAGSLPQNPVAEATNTLGYHEVAKSPGQANWLEDGQEHAMRLEIHRAGISGPGAYTIKVWIDGTGAAFADVTADYTAAVPDLLYAATLSATDHAKLETIYFGWTEATGSVRQTVTIHDFSLDFRR